MSNSFVELTLHEQEVEGNYDFFHAEHFVMRGFMNFFVQGVKAGGEELCLEFVAEEVARDTLHRMLSMIHNKYGAKADYLQVFDCTYNNKSAKMYAIHDESHVTFMLAEEY